MKTQLHKILIGLLLLAGSFTNTLIAQCSGGTFAGTITPTAVYQSQNVPSGGLYYTFNATAGLSYQFSFCAADGASCTYDSQITIRDNSDVYAGGYSDDFCGLQSFVSWIAPSTATYRVLISQYSCTTNSIAAILRYKVIVPAGNDACSGAVALTMPSTTSSTTVGMTSDATSCNTFSSNGVWYTVVGNGNMFTASLCGSSYDTWVSIYTGTCAGLTCLIQNDDFCGLQSQVSFCTNAGTTYFILVNGFSTNSGAFTLALSQAAPPAPVTVTPSSATICNGSSTGLSASAGFSTYTWSPGTGLNTTNGQNVTANPTSNITYTVSTSGPGAGCVSSTTVPVTVNPSPTVTATATSPTICAGGSTTLNSSGAVSYTWNPGSLTGASVSVAPTSTTTYTVTGTGGNGCTSTGLVTVTVNPLPTITASASPASICVGASSTLTGNGGTTYSWMPGSLSGTSVTVTPGSTQTYTVTGTSGGCSNTGNVTVTVNPLPTITATASPATICTGSSSTLTGSGGSTYTWMPGSLSGTSVTVSPSSTTTYTVTGTNGSGCVNTGNVTVTVNPLPTISATASPATICAGSSSTLTGNGGTTYSWMPGSLSGTTVSVAPGSSTTYTVTGTNGNGCVNTGNVTVTVNPLPNVLANTTASSVCAGNSVTLTGSGAASYTWTGGVTNGVAFAPVSTNTYTVSGTDANGCVGTDNVTVTVNPLPGVTANATSTSVCTGSSVTLTGGGATSYTWSGGVTDGVAFTPVSTNTYTVTGTDGNGCDNTASITVTVNPTPTVTATAGSPSICNGSSTTLTGNGATTYTWMPGSLSGTTVTVSPTTTTTYTVTGTSGAGCVSTGNVTVTVNPIPTVTATAGSPTICTGSSTTLTGNGAATYTWMPGSLSGTTVTVSPTTTTTYTVTGTSGAGCTSTGNVTVTVNPLPTVGSTASPSSTVCAGSSVTLNGTGATTYTWSGGVINGVAFVPVSTTTYTVTGTSAAGCTNTATQLVTVNPLPTVGSTASPSATVCAGSSVTLSGTGATTYTWSGGVTNAVAFVPVSTTTYTVTGTSAAGCINTATQTVTVNPLPTVGSTASPSTTVCAGSSVTLNGTGATTYTWSGGVTNGISFVPVSTTTYTVTGTDGNGCTNTASTTVTVNPLPTVTANSTASAVCTGNSVTLTGGGATTYTWSGGVTDGISFVPTSTTTYTVTGTNGNGCTNTATTTVIVNPLPTVGSTASPSTSVCTGSSVTLNGTGATTYTWSGGVTNGISFVPVSTTTYTVTGTDGNGCTNTASTTVTVNPLPTVTANSTASAVCAGNSVTLTGSGATSYTWTGGVTNGISFVPVSTTTYTVTGTDGNGCTNTASTTVTVNPLPTVTANSTASAVCAGNSVTLTGGGATSYTWSGGVTDGISFVPVSTTTYTVTGTDANGCSNTASTTVTVNSLPIVALGPDVTQCAGTVVLDAQNAGSTYLWSDNSTAQTLTASASGTYSVVVTNSFGCTANDAINITINALPVVALGADVTQCGGSVTLDAQNAGSTYLWNDNSTNQTLTVTLSGVYSVVVTTTNGCTATDAINITINPVPVVNLGPDQAVCSGTIPLDAQNAGATYLWSDNSLTQTITATTTGIYWVDVMNSFGCVSRDSVNITINSNPVVTLGADITQCGGTTTLDAQNAGATYLWSDNSTNQMLTVSTSGTYSVLVTLPGGCTATDAINITINTVPTVALGADVTQCGGSVTLDAQNAGSTYLWSDNSTAQTLSVNTTGNYSVMVTDPSTGCMNSDTAMITINTVPVVALGADIAQCGGSVTLDAQNAGSTYLWSDNSTAQTLSVNTTGNYSVTVTDPSTGCMNSDAITVTINAAPSVALGPDATQCGGSVTLNAQNAGSTYLWSDNSTNQMLIVTATGNYFVMVTDPSTGCSNGDTIMITINTLPVITFSAADTVCINDAALILSATPAGGAFSGPGVGGSSFSPPTAGLGNATVAYSFTDANGCSASSQQVINVDACTGVVELNNNGSISVFPNPNNGNFTVQITNANGEGVLEVTDALGQVISSQNLNTTGGSLTKEISLENYSNGVYFVRFTTSTSNSIQKVIIQR